MKINFVKKKIALVNKPIKKAGLIFCAALFLFLSGCGGEAPVDLQDEDISLSEPEPEAVYGPLNHQLLDEEAQNNVLPRPIVVTIDNFAKARPQSGLNKADLIYELPAEGGISRFLAVFYCGSSDIIGPVRSARPYLVDVAKEYGGVYIHVGGSPDALNYLAKGGWPYINEFAFGKYFWRDKKRKAPHNLYTSIENLSEAIAAKGWDEIIIPEAFKFIETPEDNPAGPEGDNLEEDKGEDNPVEDNIIKDGGERAAIVRINYIAARNTYTYDEEKNFYWRQINENPHVDAVTDEQLTAANIIVQMVDSKVLDKEGRLEINMIGRGEAMLFSRGQVKKGSWERASLGHRTVFKDESGREWELSPGQTWIQVADKTVKISYEEKAN